MLLVSEQRFIFEGWSATGGNDPLKFSQVFLFVMVTVSLTASALTSLPLITKKKEKYYANLPAGSSAVPPGRGQLSEMPFVVNSFHS